MKKLFNRNRKVKNVRSEFDNMLDKKFGVHYTRWIMSWIRKGGNVDHTDWFEEWLQSLEVEQDDIDNMKFLMMNGKLECEVSAAEFINELFHGKECV